MNLDPAAAIPASVASASASAELVAVRLTEAGAALANGTPLRIQSGSQSYSFESGLPLLVERRREWLGYLHLQHTPEGALILELAPAAAASSSTATSSAAASSSAAAAVVTVTVPAGSLAAAPIVSATN